MKYKILFSIVSIVCVFIVVNGDQSALGMSAGAPQGCSGAPSDQVTCKNSGCHNGSPITTVSGWITSTIPVGGYTPGVAYTITATASYNGLNKFGFEITPEDAQGNMLGTLVNTSPQTQILFGNKYITHTSSGNSNPNSKTWTFNWIAPPSGSGPLKFYGTFACCDGDGSPLGDFVYYSTLDVTEAPTPGVDAGILPIVYPNVFVCDSDFIPIVTLRNFGTATINSVQINYFVDANSPTTYSWAGILAPGGSAQVSLPQLIISAQGTHTFTATTSNPNGGADAFTVNDSKNVIFQSVYSSRSMPFTEGFEAATFPPAGWARKNPDNGWTWDRYTFVHYTGVACMFINNYGYNSKGQKDEMITPEINLSTSPTPSLVFQMAYQMYSDSGSPIHSSDTLSIFVSTDCGTTWTMLYNKYDTALTTSTPPANNLQFFPDSTEWRQETIDLTPYAWCNNALIKFLNTTDYGNELFIDDINISGPVGIANNIPENNPLQIFPVPASDFLSVNFKTETKSPVTMQVFDIEGKKVYTISDAIKPDGEFTEVINVKDFSPGIYFMRITSGEKETTGKFIVTH
jgi:hypothetical protein